MESALTISRDPEDGGDYLMLVGSFKEWQEIVRNVDGIGHSPEMMELLSELDGWGIRK